MVFGVFRGLAVRAVRVAIAEALRSDNNVTKLVPDAQIYATERATIPTLPSIELIGVTSERVDTGPMVRHELSVECTVSHQAEDGADELLDSIVRAVRQRLDAAERSDAPITQEAGEACLCVLGGTRWSTSAANTSGVIRGASVSIAAVVSE